MISKSFNLMFFQNDDNFIATNVNVVYPNPNAQSLQVPQLQHQPHGHRYKQQTRHFRCVSEVFPPEPEPNTNFIRSCKLTSATIEESELHLRIYHDCSSQRLSVAGARRRNVIWIEIYSCNLINTRVL